MYFYCGKLREIYEMFIVVSNINIAEYETKKYKSKPYLFYLEFEKIKKTVFLDSLLLS